MASCFRCYGWSAVSLSSLLAPFTDRRPLHQRGGWQGYLRQVWESLRLRIRRYE